MLVKGMLRPHFLHAPAAPLRLGQSANVPPAGRSGLGPQQDGGSPPRVQKCEMESGGPAMMSSNKPNGGMALLFEK